MLASYKPWRSCYGDDAQSHAAELAHHFAQAEAVTGTGKLVHYSLLAGQRALVTYAHDEAIKNFERGLLARDITLSGTEAASDEEAAALLFGLAQAKTYISVWHQLAAVVATLCRAFEYYAEAGNVALAVAVAEFPVAPPGNRIPGLAEMTARALSLVPPDSHEAGHLLSRYGAIIGGAEGDYEGAQQALGRALSIARRGRDVALEVQTLTLAAEVHGRHLRWQQSVDNGLRAIELITSEDTRSELISRFWIARSLLLMCDLNAARPHILVLRHVAERRSAPRQLAANSFGVITSLSCLEWDWKAGRESSDRGLEISPLNHQLQLSRVMLEHETGESAQGEVYLDRLLEGMRRRPDQLLSSIRLSMAITATARVTGVSNRLEIAEAAAETVLSNQSDTLLEAMYARAAVALLAVQKGARSAAAEHYANLLD